MTVPSSQLPTNSHHKVSRQVSATTSTTSLPKLLEPSMKSSSVGVTRTSGLQSKSSLPCCIPCLMRRHKSKENDPKNMLRHAAQPLLSGSGASPPLPQSARVDGGRRRALLPSGDANRLGNEPSWLTKSPATLPDHETNIQTFGVKHQRRSKKAPPAMLEKRYFSACNSFSSCARNGPQGNIRSKPGLRTSRT